MQPLDGKVAIVTGSGRGIGRATALALAVAGAKLIINDLDEEPARQAVEAIRAAGSDALIALGSVASPEVAAAMVEAAHAKWGRLDILVNNAGLTRDAMLHRMTDEQFTLVMDVVVRGSFNMTRACAASWRDAARVEEAAGQRVHRKIVNVSSITGIHGAVGNANYATAKAALIGLTKASARELAPSLVNCNAVAPGIIDTRMTAARETSETPGLGIPAGVRDKIIERMPFGRIGTPGDVADAIVFLASPASDFITGQVLQIDGGMEFIDVVG
ncbi:MAG: glucose 1-dehydrogenase [Acidobacteriia bacterium]|nr:glucose 1-dehydrogenase [Terriglobia bacterium]